MLAVADIRHLPIGDDSIDMIFTDPPYPTKYLWTYEALAQEVVRVLKPGGWVVCMAGGLNLPSIFRFFEDAGLTYFFTMVLKSSGAAPLVWRHVGARSYPIVARAKHLLVYSKGPATPRRGGVVNLFESGEGWSRAKLFHKWGQDVNTCRYYIEYFSEPGDVVLDPFVGGGTTIVAARLVGREAIGFDIDPAAIETTRRRVEEAWVPVPMPLFEA